MTANIHWTPEEQSSEILDVCQPSSFISAMDRAFGDSPWVLAQKDLDRLQGMNCVCDRESSAAKEYQKLIELVVRHGAIRVWPEA